MTNYERLVRKPSFFRMFTGLSAGEFDKLLADLEPVWLARQAKQAVSRPRKRKPGAGRKAKLRLLSVDRRKNARRVPRVARHDRVVS